MNRLRRNAALGLASVLTCIGAAIFLPAWTFDYWQAWVFLCVYAACNVMTIVYLWKNDRALLERRMRGGPLAEGEPTQRIIMLLASLGFVSVLAISGLDHRMHWSNAPPAVVACGDLLVALGFYVVILVFRENSFAASTIQVAGDQRVISSGLYAIVRHPMYAGGALLIAGIPLALGSYWGMLAFAAMLPVLIWRLLDEEAFLAKNLVGYREYEAKVRWRMVPGIF